MCNEHNEHNSFNIYIHRWCRELGLRGMPSRRDIVLERHFGHLKQIYQLLHDRKFFKYIKPYTDPSKQEKQKRYLNNKYGF